MGGEGGGPGGPGKGRYAISMSLDSSGPMETACREIISGEASSGGWRGEPRSVSGKRLMGVITGVIATCVNRGDWCKTPLRCNVAAIVVGGCMF